MCNARRLSVLSLELFETPLTRRIRRAPASNPAGLQSFSAARNAIASPLLRLPAEIRHEIYAYVASVGTYKVDGFDGPTGPDFYISGPLPSWLGLLHTCRQIYAEASALPYALNTFRLVPHHIWYPWVTQLAKLRNPITSLRL
jgi:hypothetical protein